jgi:hypothetical protein
VVVSIAGIFEKEQSPGGSPPGLCRTCSIRLPWRGNYLRFLAVFFVVLLVVFFVIFLVAMLNLLSVVKEI